MITWVFGDSNRNIELKLLYQINHYNKYVTKHIHLPPHVSTYQNVKLTNLNNLKPQVNIINCSIQKVSLRTMFGVVSNKGIVHVKEKMFMGPHKSKSWLDCFCCSFTFMIRI